MSFGAVRRCSVWLYSSHRDSVTVAASRRDGGRDGGRVVTRDGNGDDASGVTTIVTESPRRDIAICADRIMTRPAGTWKAAGRLETFFAGIWYMNAESVLLD